MRNDLIIPLLPSEPIILEDDVDDDLSQGRHPLPWWFQLFCCISVKRD
jgi:hypothetical protein